MNKPANWYQMDYEEQRAWKKAERERQDLEYERDRAERAREDAEYALSNQRKQANNTISGLREDYAILSDDYNYAVESLERAEAFIESKGLREEYQNYEG